MCAVVIDEYGDYDKFMNDVKHCCVVAGSEMVIYESKSELYPFPKMTQILINAEETESRKNKIGIIVYDVSNCDHRTYPLHYTQNHFYEIAMYHPHIDEFSKRVEPWGRWAIDEMPVLNTFALSADYFFDNIYQHIERPAGHSRNIMTREIDSFLEEY